MTGEQTGVFNMKTMKQIGAAIGAFCLLAINSVHAAVPASVTTAFGDLSDDFETVFALGFGVLVVVVVAMLSWRYFKKLGSKV
jgi:hypothetical protein